MGPRGLLSGIRFPAHEWIHLHSSHVDPQSEAAPKATLAWSLKDSPVSGHVMPCPSWALCQRKDHRQLCSATWEQTVISTREQQDRGLYKSSVKTDAHVFAVHTSPVGCEQDFCQTDVETSLTDTTGAQQCRVCLSASSSSLGYCPQRLAGHWRQQLLLDPVDNRQLQASAPWFCLGHCLRAHLQ